MIEDKNKKILQLKTDIENEINVLKQQLLKEISNNDKYIKRLEQNLKYIKWVNKKLKISMSGRKYTVAQREIYYCNLGVNIGSEQSDNRPVVVLQNNAGNQSGNTTIIAPITSHEKSVQYDKLKNKYFIEMVDVYGDCRKKYLDYYEVPIVIEDNSSKKIWGFVNIAHIREIDRKRITDKKIAIITEDCFNEIKSAINKNLR